MAQIPNTKIYLNKQQQAEFDRIAAASARLVERAKRDKSEALKILRDMGYFEIMAAEAAAKSAEAIPSAATNGHKHKIRATTSTSKQAAKRKRAKGQ